MIVQQILGAKDNNHLITVTPDTNVADATRLLAEHRIGGLIVSDDGANAVGILSERDIVRAMAVVGGNCLNDRVGELMTPDPVCCAKTDSAVSLLEKMTEGRFRHMPVVEDGRIVGMVTLGDVVKARLQELSMEKEALESMVMGF